MKIKKIISQHRRDFTALMECEHCGQESVLDNGYDDRYFHDTIIPKLVCGKCGNSGIKAQKPTATKYPEGQQI